MASTYFSLFTGVGGLDEGFRAAIEYLTGQAPACLGCCEWEAYAAGILLARMAESALEPAPVWCGDICDLDGRELRGRVDWLIGGFPCQDVSAAGKGEGIRGRSGVGSRESGVKSPQAEIEVDSRPRTPDTGLEVRNRSGLWYEYARLIGEIRPFGAYIENVSALRLPGRGLDRVLTELAALGYHAVWDHLRAADVGAPHQRDRIFILAWDPSQQGRLHTRQRRPEQAATNAGGDVVGLANAGTAGRRPEAPVGQQIRRVTAGGSSASNDAELADAAGARPDGTRAEPDQPQHPSHGSEQRGQPVGHAESGGVEGIGAGGLGEPRAPAGPALSGCPGAQFPPGPADTAAWRWILERWPHLAPALKSGFRVLADELAVVVDESRADQLRCGGNGVVPLQAAVAFIQLAKRAGLT